jgi:hypothetical protein
MAPIARRSLAHSTISAFSKIKIPPHISYTFTIRRLQWSKDADVVRLELVYSEVFTLVARQHCEKYAKLLVVN